MWDNICFLGVEKETENDIGDSVIGIVYDKEIFCKEKSVKASQFYQAQALGLKPETILEIMIADYNKEKYVKFEDEEFKVLRTYKTSSEKIELTLVRGINDGNS